ncbi:MAG: asparagine synthase-related protein [Pseudomonadota bacterium]
MVSLFCGWHGAVSDKPVAIDDFASALIASEPLRQVSGFSHLVIGDVTLALANVPPSNAPSYHFNNAIVHRGAVGLVADCRLHNRAALRVLLPDQAMDDDASDADIIAALYCARGEDGLDALRGDFAFALYDADQDRLILRRDHFGVRPLYYSRLGGDGFAFASLARAFTGSGLVAHKRDWDTSLAYLATNVRSGDGTMVEDVRLLGAAHQLTLAQGMPHVRRYWHLTPPRLARQNPDYDQWCAGLKQRFDHAVAVRLPLCGPVASELSAGLDAGGITATAANLLPAEDQHVHAYIGTLSDDADPDLFVDESAVAQDIVKASNRISMTKVAHAPGPPGLLAQPEPDRIEGSYVLREDETCRLAAESGADTVLCGWGGDQCVTYLGHQAFSHALRRGHLGPVWGDIRNAHAQKGLLGAARRAAAIGLTALLPMGRSRPIKTWLRGESGVAETQRDIMGLRPQYRGKTMRDHDGGDVTLSQIAGLEQIADTGRLDSLAATSARHGVQYSFPMLDVDLVEYMLTCPPEFLCDRDMQRKPFRTIMLGVLPDSIRLRRQKMLPSPELPFGVAENRGYYLERLAVLERDSRLHEYVDFAHLRKRLVALPEADTLRPLFRQNAARGEQTRPGQLNASFLSVDRIERLQQWLDEDGPPQQAVPGG